MVGARDRGDAREPGDAGQHPIGEVRVHPHPLPLGTGERRSASTRPGWRRRSARRRGGGRHGARAVTSSFGRPSCTAAASASAATLRECPSVKGHLRSTKSPIAVSRASRPGVVQPGLGVGGDGERSLPRVVAGRREERVGIRGERVDDGRVEVTAAPAPGHRDGTLHAVHPVVHLGHVGELRHAHLDRDVRRPTHPPAARRRRTARTCTPASRSTSGAEADVPRQGGRRRAVGVDQRGELAARVAHQRGHHPHPLPQRLAARDVAEQEPQVGQARPVDEVGVAAHRDVVAEPAGVLLRVRVTADPHEQRRVVDRGLLLAAEAEPVGQPARDRPPTGACARPAGPARGRSRPRARRAPRPGAATARVRSSPHSGCPRRSPRASICSSAGVNRAPPDEEDAALREPEVAEAGLRRRAAPARRGPRRGSVARPVTRQICSGAALNRGPFGVAPRRRILPDRSMPCAPSAPSPRARRCCSTPPRAARRPSPSSSGSRASRPARSASSSSSPSTTSSVWSSRQDTSMLGTWTVAATEPKYRGQVQLGGSGRVDASSGPAGRGARSPGTPARPSWRRMSRSAR